MGAWAPPLVLETFERCLLISLWPEEFPLAALPKLWLAPSVIDADAAGLELLEDASFLCMVLDELPL